MRARAGARSGVPVRADLLRALPRRGHRRGHGRDDRCLADVGIDDDFIKQVREKVTEGTSALFALTSGATAPDKVIDELK